MHSKHGGIQKLMDEIESLDPKTSDIEAKLQIIAQKVAIEQQKIKATVGGTSYDSEAMTDPNEAFVCDGCQ